MREFMFIGKESMVNISKVALVYRKDAESKFKPGALMLSLTGDECSLDVSPEFEDSVLTIPRSLTQEEDPTCQPKK